MPASSQSGNPTVVRDLRARLEFFMAMIRSQSFGSSALQVAIALLYRHFNGTTGRCDPSIARLANETGLQERSVKRAIRELAESDWWQVAGRSGAGRGHTNQYRPHFEKGDNPDTFSGYEMVTGLSPFDAVKGDKLGQKKVSNLSPKPRKNQEEDSMSVHRAATNPESEAIFEEVWRTLPKRDGANPKKPARLEFERAMTRGADPRAILRGAHNYRLQIDHQAPDDRRFIPQVTTWLKQERWDQYQEPPGPPPRQRLPGLF